VSPDVPIFLTNVVSLAWHGPIIKTTGVSDGASSARRSTNRLNFQHSGSRLIGTVVFGYLEVNGRQIGSQRSVDWKLSSGYLRRAPQWTEIVWFK